VSVAALIVWIVAAAGGFILLGTWIAKSGQKPGASRFPAGVIFGHFGLAAAGLILWIVYLITDARALAWVALVVVVVIALLGFTMFLRWIPTCRVKMGRAPTAPAATSADQAGGAAAIPVTDLAESHFAVPVVVAHGLFAVGTLVLVLLTALAL